MRTQAEHQTSNLKQILILCPFELVRGQLHQQTACGRLAYQYAIFKPSIKSRAGRIRSKQYCIAHHVSAGWSWWLRLIMIVDFG
jgi:hypothetical protein